MHGFACASAENMTELYPDLQGQCPGSTAEDLRCHQGHLQFLWMVRLRKFSTQATNIGRYWKHPKVVKSNQQQ